MTELTSIPVSVSGVTSEQPVSNSSISCLMSTDLHEDIALLLALFDFILYQPYKDWVRTRKHWYRRPYFIKIDYSFLTKLFALFSDKLHQFMG